MNSLITLNQVPGYFNYTKQEKIQKGSFQLVQVEELEDVFLSSLMQVAPPDNLCLSCGKSLRSDLPLTSDFGSVETPYDLVYARLEGLQYLSNR